MNGIITTVINFAKKKFWWIIAFALSIVYIYAFYNAIENNKPGRDRAIGDTDGSDLLFGFCVWGKYTGDDNGLHHGLYPDEDGGCSPLFPVNSHLVAFIIDVIMTLLTFLFYFKDKKDKTNTWWMYLGVGGIIFMHGCLHLFLQKKQFNIFGKIIPGINCYIDLNPGTDESVLGEILASVEDIGYVIFFTFSFFLSIIIFKFGFPEKDIKSIVLSSLAFAVIVVFLTKDSGGDLFLPGLFVVAHPVSCITGLLSAQPAFNITCAKLFALCTAVGILELTACGKYLRPIGGHFWYDITLHAAVLAALPLFDPPDNLKGKQD
mmetsp:Transcript_261/g.450  ORF Transcript_261/g.450 Transcript_261/m.450 type:complete len:320 (-) Transcript_261:88-1047(-)